MPETDGQLYLKFCRDDDPEAFRILYEKYRESLMLFINGIVGNMDDAEELMMDTFAVLYSKTARYRDREESGFKTWLYAVAKNRAKMFLRKHRTLFPLNEDETSEKLEEAGDTTPESLIIGSEQNRKLYSALETLDPDTRQVLYLIYFEDMKPADVSRVMKKNVKQIYNLAARGRASLKEVLERMGYIWDM